MATKQIKRKHKEGRIRKIIKEKEKPESMISLIGVLASAFVCAYVWLIILGG